MATYYNEIFFHSLVKTSRKSCSTEEVAFYESCKIPSNTIEIGDI